jgi:Leucine-rich repeat (LRR) protein
MNKKTISILCLTVLYSILFYQQHVGINFLLFTLAALGFFFYQDKTAFKSKPVLLISFAAVFAASCATIYNSNLAMWSTIVALFVVPGVFINKRSAIIVDFICSLYTNIVSSAYMIIDAVESGKSNKGKGFLYLLKYLVPLVFVITFFFIYRAMNPLFEKFTQEIAEIISIGWLFFTLGGFVLVYGFYKQQRSEKVDNWEKNWALNILPESVKIPKWNEGIAFILLFVVLNLMLISVNFMDINYLYLGEGMPDGITHKQFVHKGVGMLILSIILGISILLFFFRGSLNFTKNKNLIKLLAFLWVLQNAFMVVSTTIRNTMYVDAALLTYKRIGVYFWLFFALIGLITLFIKLQRNKTVWFLSRQNFMALFIVLIGSSAIDWDYVISDFNLNRARQMEEISSLDKNYMLSLSETNIAGLYSIKNLEGFETDSIYSYANSYLSNSNWLDIKLYDFLVDDAYGDWRSYSLRRNRVRKEIQTLDDNGMLTSLELQGHYRLSSLEPLKKLNKLAALNLNSTNINTPIRLAEINHLRQLKKLSLDNNYISNLDTLANNNQLVYLSLTQNDIRKLTFLKSFPNLDTLVLSRNQLVTLSSLPELKKLKSINLDNNPLTDVNQLKKLTNLTSLSLNGIALNSVTIPAMDNLEYLSISNSKNIVKNGLGSVHNYPKLKQLNISYNELSNLSILIDEKSNQFPVDLESLNINANQLTNLYGIENFSSLTYLDASSNQLYLTNGLEKLTKLKQLYLDYNDVSDLSFLMETTQLQTLSLSDNKRINNFDAIQQLNQLTTLNLTGTAIIDLGIINKAAPIQLLNLTGCKIKDLTPLKDLKHLENLNLSFVKEEDITVLKQLKGLKYLRINNTEEEVITLIKEALKEVIIN